MKRLLYSLLVLLVTIQFSTAQGIKFGVFVEPQMTWLSPETRNTHSNGIDIGINGGLMLDKYFQKNYAIHTGISLGTINGSILYKEGTTVQTDENEVTIRPGYSVDYKLQYLTVPLGLKLKTNQIGYFTYFAQLGLTGQINIKAKAESSDGALQNDIINKEIALFNLTYHFGIGAEYALSKDNSFLFGIIYNNGFIDITDNSARVRTRVLALRLGFIF